MNDSRALIDRSNRLIATARALVEESREARSSAVAASRRARRIRTKVMERRDLRSVAPIGGEPGRTNQMPALRTRLAVVDKAVEAKEPAVTVIDVKQTLGTVDVR